jgi:hypothetical protein
MQYGCGHGGHNVAMTATAHKNVCRIAACWLAICVAAFVFCSMRWHAVSDLAQLNYICFLMHHGMALYRDILEVNMPGTFLVNCGMMHLFGASDLAWRIFDLALLAIAALAMASIARPYGWFAGTLAGALFALLHGNGGEEQLAQRDLIVAVLLICAYAFMLFALRRARGWPWLFFGTCVCAAAAIKPPAAIVLLVLLPAMFTQFRTQRRSAASALALCAAGIALPLLAVFWFLARQHAVGDFFHTFTHVLPAYANIGRKSFIYLLRVSKIVPLLFVWTALAVALARNRHEREPERRLEIYLLAFGTFFGVAYYFIQGKGFPYHLYPWAAFAILWSSIEIATAMRRNRAARGLAYAGLALGLTVAPAFAIHAIRMPSVGNEFNQALTADLNALGGQQLNDRVQCLVTSGECAMVLHKMRLVQATGLVYDFMVFGSNSTPIQQEMRARVWQQWQRNPPRVVIVRSYLWPDHPCSLGIAPDDAAAWEQARYNKLQTWPEFSEMLARDYHLDRENTFAEVEAPCRFQEGYRIYVRNG